MLRDVASAVGQDDRDFFAEGADAALAGASDLPPSDVSACGPDAEAEWIDGYESVDDE